MHVHVHVHVHGHIQVHANDKFTVESGDETFEARKAAASFLMGILESRLPRDALRSPTLAHL